MANPKPNNGWEDKKRPMFRNDTSLNKRPRLDVRVVSSSKSSGSPHKNVSPAKLFKRATSLPSCSRDSPSPTDEILLSAAKASEEEEARAVRELKGLLGDGNEFKDCSNKVSEGPSTSKTDSSSAKVDKKSVENQQIGNNGSSGFDKLFSDEINEDFVEECMNLATALSQQTTESPPPVMSQAYEYFFKGVKTHSSILEKTTTITPSVKAPVNNAQSSAVRPTPKRPFTSASATPTTTAPPSSRLSSSTNNQSFRKPQTPAFQKPQPQPGSKLQSITEEQSQNYPPGAEAVIRRLELEVERLTMETKKIKEKQNTKDGEAAVLRFQVQEGQNKMKQLKSTHEQALSAMNEQYNEKIRNLQKETENLRSQLQVQVMENSAVRERSKLLESSNSRIRLVEPQSPKGVSSLNISMVKSQKNRRPSAFLNRSTFEEDVRSAPETSSKCPTSGHDEILPEESAPRQNTAESDGLWYRFDFPERNVGCSLALRLAGWERIQADDSDDSNSSCSARRVEYDTDSSLDLFKIGPVRSKTRKRLKVLSEKDRPGLSACVVPLRTIFFWPEANLESPAAQDLLRKVAVECCGLVHYKYIFLKEHEIDMDEKVLYERDCDIVERGGEVLDLMEEMDLLDDRPWYKGEHGISSRRALGLLSELAFVSSSFSALLTGSLSARQAPLERHRFTKSQEYLDHFRKENNSEQSQSTKKEQQQAGERMETDKAKTETDSGTSNDPDRYWFLEILAELCFTIAKQKRTNQFNGVFVALLTLLKNCARNGSISGEARPIVLRVIRGVLLARPSFYTLRCLLHLLEHLSDCQDLMTGLCTYDDHDNYQEDLNHKLIYFRSDSCILHLLCTQLNSAGKSRWHLADPMARWLLAVFAHTNIPPRWLVPHFTSMRQDGDDTADSGYSLCCPRIISTAVTLCYEAFQTLKDCIDQEVSDFSNQHEETERRAPLPRVMQRALILVHTLVVNDLSEYMGRVEGDYDVFIPGLNRIRQRLNLASNHEKLLDDLVRIEEVGDPPGAIDSGGEEIVSGSVWDGAIKGCVIP